MVALRKAPLLAEPLLGYHFTSTRLHDGRRVPKPGVALKHWGGLIPRTSGLHAALDPWIAIMHAPDSWAHLVRCEGRCVRFGAQGEILCCSVRTILASCDVLEPLHNFACKLALGLKDFWTPSDFTVDWLKTRNPESLAQARLDCRSQPTPGPYQNTDEGWWDRDNQPYRAAHVAYCCLRTDITRWAATRAAINWAYFAGIEDARQAAGKLVRQSLESVSKEQRTA